MTWLADNFLAIGMLGAVALAMALFVYFQTRTNRALYGVAAVIMVTAALLLTSWLIDTPREAVERTLYSLAATVEANDVPGALAFLSPLANPQLRKDVETLMPQVRIERARIIGSPQIDLDGTPNPTSATVRCTGAILAVNKQDGMKGGAEDHLIIYWARPADRWLLVGYKSDTNWHRALGH